jgi:hypothetical protein
VPAGPPFDLEVLADLHAGVFSDEVAAVLRARVAADPGSAAVLAALDATVADLHALPPVPIPPQVAARLDAVIAAESAARTRSASASEGTPSGVTGPSLGAAGAPPAAPLPFVAPPRRDPSPPQAPSPPPAPSPTPPPHQVGGTVSSLDHARRARQSRNTSQRRWAIGLGVAAAVAAVFAIGAVIVNPGGTPGSGFAGDLSSVTTATHPTTGAGAGATQGEPAPSQGGTQAPPARTQAVVATPHHLADLLPQIDGKAPAGPFADHDRLQACLAANDASGDEVLGVLPVSYTGEDAYAISLRAPDGTVRILIVGGACGQSGADLKEEQTTHG